MERHFSLSDLRDLFKLEQNTTSDTHDKLKCRRCVAGVEVVLTPYLSNLIIRAHFFYASMNLHQVRGPPEDSDCNSDLSCWHHAASKKGLQV